jgi:hypothetical protein
VGTRLNVGEAARARICVIDAFAGRALRAHPDARLKLAHTHRGRALHVQRAEADQVAGAIHQVVLLAAVAVPADVVVADSIQPQPLLKERVAHDAVNTRRCCRLGRLEAVLRSLPHGADGRNARQ